MDRARDACCDLPRRRLLSGAASLAALALAGCGGGGGGAGGAGPASRTWRMGFYPNAPQPTSGSVLEVLDAISARAELVHVHEELPWTALLAGQSADDLANAKLPLVGYLRGKGLRLGFMADLTDGLDRSQEPPQLRALGRSITEPAVQAAYRAYVLAVARNLQPDYVGLTAETNLVRLQAPPAVYAAMVQAARASAADLLAAGATVPLLISVQVEVAWGHYSPGLQYQGIEADLADFPFLTQLGLSSYPYFVYATPEDLPVDYYSRLLGGRSLPAMVAEGGWTSASVAGVQSTPDEQRRYVLRQGALLDSIGATAIVQTLYADIDLSAYPPDLGASLLPFATLGLVDAAFGAKPALAAWDGLFARRRA
ncbi:MAG: hypothetical protein JSR54_02820 [Proteobacteria bacterium]|nr:hypothetical protein [Pseudomonadota bacterium]